MRLIPFLLVLAIPMAAAEEYWVPVVAHTPGVNDTVWTSDVGILNSCSSAATVEFRLHTADGVASDSWIVRAGTQQIFEDIAAQLVDGDVVAPLEIRSDQPLTVTSRTFTTGFGGTFGQSIDGVTVETGLAAGEVARLQQLQENAAFRTNLGVLNASDAEAKVTITLYDLNGVFVGAFDLQLAASELVQQGRPYLALYERSDIIGGYAEIAVTAGSEVIAYASVVDENTGDPTTINMVPAPSCDPAEVGDLVVEVYDPERAHNGTTLIGLIGVGEPPRVLEIDMYGNIVWELDLPPELENASGALEAQTLDNGNILVMVFGLGIFEVTRTGELVWSYETADISHDADRLANGNTIYSFGMDDQQSDAQVVEIDTGGNIVWQWFAADAYADRFPGAGIEGWSHNNAVQRLPNGHTLVSPRNFALSAIVDQSGAVVEEYDWSSFGPETMPHEPVVLPNGNLLVCVHAEPDYHAVEIDRATGATAWTYAHPTPLRTTRDCDRLPNGNTLIVGVKDEGDGETIFDESTIVEVTLEGDVVWQLTLYGVAMDTSPGLLFKAERIGTNSED